MKFTIHALELHRTIYNPESAEIHNVNMKQNSPPDGTIAIYAFRSLVAKNDLEPPPEAHLAEKGPASEIPPGLYLFTQAELPENNSQNAFRDAAEAVWLEALWREIQFKSDRIFVRILEEESMRIFQIFREIEKNEK